jgi:hypothetical protein
VGAQEVGKAVHCWLAGGRTAALARVTEIRGVGSAAEGELFVCNNAELSCGGSVSVIVQSTAGIPRQLWSALAERRPVALSTVIDPGMAGHESMVTLDVARSFGSLGDPDLDRTVEGSPAGSSPQPSPLPGRPITPGAPC